ncbi:MAG: (2Fe-2S) ferredoxin domain-containing protein [Cytophagaceae bacterium]|nr:(2Fe-2S) ferredoxin domain-containing protein [Cytophagaceae bacterium]MDW8457085.1 (2Fe-2S) ferredoxin domain-containing protein [Cytophagaceae bacterium]
MKYQKHIFVCTNQRTDGRKCCGESTGMALVNEFKNYIHEHKLQHIYRAQRAGCFDVCQSGPAVTVYPDGVFYGNVKVEDVKEIFEQHILGGKPVERLKLDFKPDL